MILEMTSISLSICFLLNIFAGIISSQSIAVYDKENFYKVFSKNDLTLISAELKTIQHSDFNEKEAFEGALLMRKADVIGNPKDKLSVFKAGNAKLEHAIKSAPDNAEYRFLRLMIQEKAPKFLGYNKNIAEDKSFITTNYKTLPTVVKEAVKNYSKTSSVLTPDMFP